MGSIPEKEKLKVTIYKGGEETTRNIRYAQAGRSVRHYSVFTKLFFCTFSNSHKTIHQFHETNSVSMTYVPKFDVHFTKINIYMQQNPELLRNHISWLCRLT